MYGQFSLHREINPEQFVISFYFILILSNEFYSFEYNPGNEFNNMQWLFSRRAFNQTL
jgi:hypothetical protein